MRLQSNKACSNKSEATIARCLEQQSREASLKVMPRGMRLQSNKACSNKSKATIVTFQF
jgi:hypothetical protein